MQFNAHLLARACPQAAKALLYSAIRATHEDEFELAWKQLNASVPQWAVKYLDSLLVIKDQWAHCYRVGLFTAGINSTQRVEGAIGAAKKELDKKGSLMVSGVQLFHPLFELSLAIRACVSRPMYVESCL